MEGKLEHITNLLQGANLNNVKKNALLVSKEAFKHSNISNEANLVVNNLLNDDINKLQNTNTINQFVCDICSSKGLVKICANEWGLKIHKSKQHK